MLSDKSKGSVTTRLKRIEGQVSGVRRMVEDNRYCIDVLTQITAVISALRGVEDIVMKNHLETCVTDAIQGSDPVAKQEKLEELMSVIGKFRKSGR